MPSLQSELDRILTSASFDASERNRQFLAYIGAETMAGRGERIKAYSIALAVFGRPESFDPLLDPIVRIEAMRLRRSLDRFYLLEGSRSGQRLSIPKGRYVPVLEPFLKEGSDPDVGLPSVRIAGFQTDGSRAALRLERALVQELMVDISRFPNLIVFGPAGQEPVRSDYVLQGKTAQHEGSWHVALHLARDVDDHVLWAGRFCIPMGREDGLPEGDLTGSVARTLAQAYGVIFADSARNSPALGANRNSSAYQAVHDFLEYWRSLDQAGIGTSLSALQAAIEAEPRYAEARACLSMLYTNQARYHTSDPDTARRLRQTAMRLASEAVDLAPGGSWGYYALGLSYWFLGDIAGSISALEHAVALNPNDMLVLSELGHRYAMRMDWDRAVPMIRAAYEAFPALPPSSLVGLFLYHLHRREFDEARACALRIFDLPIPQGALALAAAAGERGDRKEAREALERLDRISPGYEKILVPDLLARNLHPTLIEEVRVGLLKAIECARRIPG